MALHRLTDESFQRQTVIQTNLSSFNAWTFNPNLDGHILITEFGAIFVIGNRPKMKIVAGKDASIAEMTSPSLKYVCFGTHDHEIEVVSSLYQLPSGLTRRYRRNGASPSDFTARHR